MGPYEFVTHNRGIYIYERVCCMLLCVYTIAHIHVYMYTCLCIPYYACIMFLHYEHVCACDYMCISVSLCAHMSLCECLNVCVGDWGVNLFL